MALQCCQLRFRHGRLRVSLRLRVLRILGLRGMLTFLLWRVRLNFEAGSESSPLSQPESTAWALLEPDVSTAVIFISAVR